MRFRIGVTDSGKRAKEDGVIARIRGTRSTRPDRGQKAFALIAALGLMLGTVVGTVAQDDKPTVAVGSKEFTEQFIVGEMLALLLEDAGYPVERQLGLAGSIVVHEALVNDQVDTYVEYTGTGLLAILNMSLPTGTPAAGAAGATPIAGVDAVYDTVKEEYAEQFNVVWLDPLGFNNTYTLALKEEQAAELGVETISDLIAVSGDLAFGGTQEFLSRPDGLPGLMETYEGLEFAESQGFDPGLVYQAVDSGDVDVISAFATDGRIPALGLATLEDDLGFFPPYYAAPVVRQELLDEDPAVADVLNSLAGLLDDQTMAGLNAQVDVDGEEPEDVARAFLEEQGLIGAE
jgi:glycine betaine/choline ABC-type transport system substrate-binding protein